MSQIPSFSSQSKRARFYLCSSQESPRLAHLLCHYSSHAPCEQVGAPSSRGSGKQLHHDATRPSQRASPASQGLACVTLARRARARSRAGTSSKFPFQKKISTCILLYNSPVVSRLQPSSHSRNARFRIVSFGHTLLFFHTVSAVLLQSGRCLHVTAGKAEITGSCY